MMKYLFFVLGQHWRILVILALFAIATTAGFMGLLKPKRDPWWVHAGTAVHFTNDWNAQAYPIQTNSNFHRLNLGGKVSDFQAAKTNADGQLSGRGDLIYATNSLRYTNPYVSNAWPRIPHYYNQTVTVGGNGPTNIVISNDYSGTIQIGTNLAKVGDIWMVDEVGRLFPMLTNAP